MSTGRQESFRPSSEVGPVGIHSGDVVLRTGRRDGSAGPTPRVRCVAIADEHQRVLLIRLVLKLPERLRLVEEAEEALAGKGQMQSEHFQEIGLGAHARRIFVAGVLNLG